MNQSISLGIDIGGTNVKIAFVTKDGKVLAQGSVPTDPERGPETFVVEVSKYAKQFASEQGIDWSDVLGAGVGMAGFLDVPRGWLEESVNLHWQDVPLGKLFKNELGKPVQLDNDANVAALGEVWLGAGRDSKTAVCVTLGTGVGGGIVIDGSVYHGVSTMAGEIGHIHVKNDGPLCNCGRNGCLETLASATAIVREGKAAGLRSEDGDLSAKDVFDKAREGNETAQAVVDDMVHWLALGLSIAANLLNPDVIVIAGGVVNAGDTLMVPLRREFEKETLQRVGKACKVVPATLGSKAGVLGAAKLVFDRDLA